MKNFKKKLSFSKFLIIIVIAFVSMSLVPKSATPNLKLTSSTFQAGHIIDDNIFTNSNSLSEGQIEQFLNDAISSVGGCYAPGSKSTNPPNGACINEFCENTTTLQNNFSNPNPDLSCPQQIAGSISSAQIIYDAAQTYQINSEVLITTIQKEEGLITDNWPWYSEYQHALGYACPDSGGCSSNYEDFYQQVSGAAWQFRNYLNNPGAYNYWIGNNYIDYAPGCAGSTVNIQNAATAALYIYTPYQPDSNVLANTNAIGSSSGPGPGISDSCAAYGNRNFWWYFNTWFGPSVDTNVYLAEESGTSTIYVVYDGQKQGIPSPDVLNAWGLNGLPVSVLDASVFNSIPNASTALTRYAVDTNNNQTYFADNGNDYYVSSNDAAVWDNFPGQTESQVTNTLVNFADYQGEIKPYINVSGNSAFYAVDDGELRPFTTGSVYGLWAGSNNLPMQLSSAYFNTMTQTGAISVPEFTYNGTAYVTSDGNTFSLSSSVAALLPSSWSTNDTISQGLFNTFQLTGPLNYMVQSSNSPAVYLLDSGTERPIPDLETYGDFQVGGGNDTSQVSADLTNAIPIGAAINSNIVSIGGQSYVMSRQLMQISSGLESAYNPSSTAITLSSPYQTLLSVSGTPSLFVKSTNSPAVYFLDNGSKYPFSNPSMLSAVAGSSSITDLTSGALSAFPTGQIMGNYITNGTNDYLLDSGNAYTVNSSSVAADWGLSAPLSLSSSGVSNFPVIGTLSQNVQIPNGQFCLIDSTTRYCAGISAMITLWNLTNGVIHPTQNLITLENIQNGGALTRFVIGQPGQPSSSTIYTVTNGQLYGIATINAAINLGYTGTKIALSQPTINSMVSGIWQGYLAEDDSGNLWVLDGGVARAVSSHDTAGWEGTNAPTTLGSVYISLLPQGPNMTNAIKISSNPTYFAVQNGEVYGIPSAQAYASSGLEPVTTVSSSLFNSIPNGGIW